jgi:hypothetical protein
MKIAARTAPWRGERRVLLRVPREALWRLGHAGRDRSRAIARDLPCHNEDLVSTRCALCKWRRLGDLMRPLTVAEWRSAGSGRPSARTDPPPAPAAASSARSARLMMTRSAPSAPRSACTRPVALDGTASPSPPDGGVPEHPCPACWPAGRPCRLVLLAPMARLHGSGRYPIQVLPQGHQRKQADDAGEDHGGFKDASGDKAKRDAFVLPLDYPRCACHPRAGSRMRGQSGLIWLPR